MKKKVCTVLTLSLLLGTVTMVKAGEIADGNLYFQGGQTSSEVYSEIYDNKCSQRGTYEDKIYYNVKASVKVGGDTYTSKFCQGYAYKSHKRSFWHNESAWYDYQQRTSAYTNWSAQI